MQYTFNRHQKIPIGGTIHESSSDKPHAALQDVGKKHGLDDFEKIKEQGVLEQVIRQLLCFHACMLNSRGC